MVDQIETPNEEIELSFEEALEAGEKVSGDIQRTELGAMFRNFKPKAEKGEAFQEKDSKGESGVDDAGEAGEEESENGEESSQEASKVVDSDELKALKEQNAALLSRVDSLLKVVEGKKPEEKKEEAPVNSDAIQKLDLTDLVNSVSDEMFQEAQESKEGMGKLLIHFGGQLAQRIIQGQVGYVDSVISQSVEQRLMVREFFAKNPDLIEHRASVATAYKLLQAEHADWDGAKVMDNLASTVRVMKGLTPPKNEDHSQPAKNQASPGSRFAKAGRGHLPAKEDKNSVGAQVLKMKGR